MSATHTPKERVMLYRAGWKSGAGPGVKAREKEGDQDYEAGYAEGLAARMGADRVALERFGVSAEEARFWVLRAPHVKVEIGPATPEEQTQRILRDVRVEAKLAGGVHVPQEEEYGTGGEYGDGSGGDCPANTEAPTNPGLNPEEYKAKLRALQISPDRLCCELCGLAGVLDTAECPAAWTHKWEKSPDGTRVPPRHGHVRSVPGAPVARCGGPATCHTCAAEVAFVKGGTPELRRFIEETVRLKASLARPGGFTPRDLSGPGRVGPARFEAPPMLAPEDHERLGRLMEDALKPSGPEALAHEMGKEPALVPELFRKK